MSKPDYRFTPADFSAIRTYPIAERKSAVDTTMFVDLEKYRASGALADLFPPMLKANDLLKVAAAIKAAKAAGKPVLLGMGAHVIKVGLAPIIIDLMRRGLVDAVALNGAGGVHDLEIAFHGETSENVAVEIKEGRFGMVDETATHFNGALARYPEAGIGEALGRYMQDERFPHNDVSIIAQGAALSVPVTLHVAVGCDIVHIHPSVDGAATGRATLADFKLFTGIVGELGGGGVYLNVGSAVILPEVFIKALSAARNLGADAAGFTTVNFDMIQHYRPGVNVVNRPIQGAGAGYALTGHHEIMVPLLYHLLTGSEG
ncbi:MAG: hypothetical protein HQK87_10490 [Nitrospinae bacterium]|nr:hypothetical protein [Nitrospinota bacterium]